ncbi:methionine--tRNA ligase [Streptomyces sp. SL13]|uniref:Methionine--tRNA ligase n=1 Tax=Streptantibioticus silvisoli TaxID=2705255 RepID=A0AA90K9A8_9ACTN|nr:methionine--tRNA ligase [Streptantibioticus silvisoli]MDI5970933.1 methionine--tRNA ligase [Streptantibioticus silvisoli]
MTAPVFVSTTIPYVNARPHLGHAFEYVQTDVYARHARSRGEQVFLSSGTDENSLKNVRAARAGGEPVRDLVDRHAAGFTALLSALGVVPDRFVRTSADADHAAGATAVWERMAARGDIYSRFYEGSYCVGCEQFLTSADLVSGCCPVHREQPVAVRERNYFFRLSRYQDEVIAALTDGRTRVTPAPRANEVLAMARAGLADISVSRSAERAGGWGIPVPGDPGQVMYVWVDALTSYVNALGGPRGGELYDRFWQGARRRVHVLGKDVARFHAVYWPAMLMSAGLPLPTDLVVHGHITSAGQKLSKTSGTVVDPVDLMDRYGAEALRYLMLADFSPWSDTDFTEPRLVARYNDDLANGLGNLVDRVTAMLHRYRGGTVPPPGTPGAPEAGLLAAATTACHASAEAFDRFEHREAVAHVWDLVRRTNAYLSEREPWRLARSAGEDAAAAAALDTVLHHAAGALATVARLIDPVLPATAGRLREVLGLRDAAHGPDGVVVTGLHVGSPPRLFPRLELSW